MAVGDRRDRPDDRPLPTGELPMIELAAPRPITRTADHVYSYEGKQYPGVTTVLKVLDKSGPLMAWAARQTAEAALETDVPALRLAVGDQGVIKALTNRATWKRDEAAQIGSQVHEWADLYVRTGSVPDGAGPHVT